MLYKAIVTATSGNTVRMRMTASSTATVLANVPVGTAVDVIQEGDAWTKIAYNNQTGYMMTKFLAKEANQPVSSGTYYVRVKCDSAEEAKRLVELLGRATVE